MLSVENLKRNIQCFYFITNYYNFINSIHFNLGHLLVIGHNICCKSLSFHYFINFVVSVSL